MSLALSAAALVAATIEWSALPPQKCPAWMVEATPVSFDDGEGARDFVMGGFAFPLSRVSATAARFEMTERPDRPRGEGLLEIEESGSIRIRWSHEGCQAMGVAKASARIVEDPMTLRHREILAAQELLRAGDRAGREGRISEALAATQKACASLRATLGPASVFAELCEARLSDRLREASRYAEAYESARLAGDALAVRVGERHVSALAARQAQAQALWYLSRAGEALELATRVAEARKELLGEEHADTLASRNTMGVSFAVMGRTAEAIAVYESVAAILERTRGADDPETLRVRNNIAFAQLRTGRTEEALAGFERVAAARRARLGERHPDTLIALANASTARLDNGDPEGALRQCEELIPAFLEVFGDTHRETLGLRRRLMNILYRLSRYREAGALAQMLIDRYSAALGPDHLETLIARLNLGTTELALGRPQSAIDHLLVAKERLAATQGADSPSLLLAKDVLAFALLRANRAQEASDLLEKELGAGELAPRASGPVPVSRLVRHGALAQARFALGERDTAVAMMKEVLERKRAQLGADHFETLESMVLLARFHESRGEANEAIALLEEVLAATERDAALGLGTDEARLSRLAARAGDNYHGTGYATLARLLVSRNPKRGLEVAELAKARTLGEALGTSVREARLPRERQEELRAIRRELARAEDRLYEAAPGSAAQLTQLAERARLKAKLAAKLPPPRASPGMPLSAIPEGAVFLSYLVSTDGIIVFAARRDGSVRAFDLGSAAGLAASVDAWRRMQASADPASERIWRVSPGHFAFSISQPGADATRARSVDEVTQALSRRALAPIESAIGTARQVIVSPDGPLAFLPFDALLFKGRALLYSTRVSHVPSLATLSFLTARVTGIAEQRGRKEFLGIAIASHEGGSAATRWSALPSAEIEAREIAATFGAGRSRLLLGAAATEAALSALDASGELKHYRYVHVATHAFLSGRDPRLSAVVLADGSVSAARWSAFRFRSDLVVLSACETGLGEVRTAEGVLGLPYAMMASGSRAALLSVWRVADEGARQFMGRFYARLRKGVDPSAALRETKLEFARSKGPWSAPRHWAPYVLYGAS